MKRSTGYKRLAQILSIGGPAGYFLFLSGVFSEGIFTTTTGIKSTVYIAVGYVIYASFKEYVKTVKDKDNTNIKQKATGKVIDRLLPWLVAFIIITLTHLGIARLYMHFSIIAGMQIISSLLYYKHYVHLFRERISEKEASVW